MAEAEAGLELPIGLTEQKFLQQLARIEARAIKSAQRSEKAFVQGNAQIGKSFGTMSGQARAGLQNVSYQLQDIFVQIQGGQGAARALSQQLPQLLSGFGLVGSAIGLVAAAGIPLVASFFNAGGEAKTLEETLKELNTALRDYESAAAAAGTPTDELVEKYGRAAGSAQMLLQQLANLAKLDAASAIRATGASIAETFEDLPSILALVDAELQQFGEGSSGIETLADSLKDTFGITIDQARTLQNILTDQSTASTPEQAADAMRRLAAFLADANLQAGYTNDALLAAERQAAQGALAGYEFATAMQSASDAAGGVVSTVDQLPGAIDAATASALALTRALSAAIAASQAVPGTIGAPTLGRFGNGEDITRRAGGMDLQEQQTFRYDWQEQLKAEEEARRKAEQAAGRKGRGGGSGGSKGRAEKQDRPFFENVERDLVNLEREITLVGKSNEEIATAKARWELLDEAKKRGIPVNAELSAQIDAQAAGFGRLTGELERAEASQQQFEQAVDGIADAMAGALVAGESLREGLAQVFKQIASDILNSGIRNAISGQLSGGGGGGFNPFAAIGNIFGGGVKVPSFNGGGFTGYGSRSGGIDGLGGMPAIVHPNETIVDHTKGQQAGGAVDVRVYMDEGGNWQAQVEKISGRVVAKSTPGILRQAPAYMDNQNKRLR
ncbi:MAG: hypothetical protein ABNH17_05550 [Paracoccus sp. (in: a-proteobacteria)]|jgi:predicted translin family RNA/ssDNA-binding protein|uniref:hypothetical protein n=1 Tax=Paracoccus sp. TaxID=267 RepID=UPI0032D8E5BC